MATVVRSIALTARWFDEACTHGAAVSSDGQKIYQVRRDGSHYSCECEGNAHWSRECRHIRALAGQIHRCSYCGTEPVEVAGAECAGCYATRLFHGANPQDVPVPESTPAEIGFSRYIAQRVRHELVSGGDAADPLWEAFN